MRLGTVAVIVGVIVFLIGLVWLLQGLNVLPGSFMTGSQFWAGAGAVSMVMGLLAIGIGITRGKS